MPNLVVYVPAKLWQRLEEKLGKEFPSWARQMTVKHMQEFLDGRHVTAGLSERKVVDGDEVQNPALDARASERRVPTPTAGPTRSESPAKPRKRLHACKHYVPPSKVCQVCDVA